MKKIIFILLFASLFLPRETSAQVKVCALPEVMTADTAGWLIIEGSACVNSTRKIKVINFIRSLGLDSAGGSGSGTVTSITVRAPLTGGVITLTGTIGADTSAGASHLATQNFASNITTDTTHSASVADVVPGAGITITTEGKTKVIAATGGAGTVTSVATRSPIFGGTITGGGTIFLNKTGIDSLGIIIVGGYQATQIDTPYLKSVSDVGADSSITIRTAGKKKFVGVATNSLHRFITDAQKAHWDSAYTNSSVIDTSYFIYHTLTSTDAFINEQNDWPDDSVGWGIKVTSFSNASNILGAYAKIYRGSDTRKHLQYVDVLAELDNGSSVFQVTVDFDLPNQLITRVYLGAPYNQQVKQVNATIDFSTQLEWGDPNFANFHLIDTTGYLDVELLVSQSGTSDPTFTVLNNPVTGLTFNGIYDDVGMYRLAPSLALSGSFSNMVATIDNAIGETAPFSSATANYNLGQDAIKIFTQDGALAAADGVLNNTRINLRIYH